MNSLEHIMNSNFKNDFIFGKLGNILDQTSKYLQNTFTPPSWFSNGCQENINMKDTNPVIDYNFIFHSINTQDLFPSTPTQINHKNNPNTTEISKINQLEIFHKFIQKYQLKFNEDYLNCILENNNLTDCCGDFTKITNKIDFWQNILPVLFVNICQLDQKFINNFKSKLHKLISHEQKHNQQLNFFNHDIINYLIELSTQEIDGGYLHRQYYSYYIADKYSINYDYGDLEHFRLEFDQLKYKLIREWLIN